MTNKKEAPLAQLVEHLTLNQGVQGSNPWRRMIRSIRVNRVLFLCYRKAFSFNALKKMAQRTAPSLITCKFSIFYVIKILSP